MPRLDEDSVSTVPALLLLQNIGYELLTEDEAFKLRGNRLNNVILDGILIPWLREHNHIEYKGQKIPFTEGNIVNAANALKELPFDGLIRTNERIYDLLCLGKSMQQTVNNDLNSFDIKYIDWENPANNVYHVTTQYEVERTASNATRIPDIVLFVNGIPFVIIECKSPHIKDPIKEAISQHIRNQKEEEIPKLFLYSQLLLSLSKNEAKYATTGTSMKYWAVWKEETPGFEQEVAAKTNVSLSGAQLDDFFRKCDVVSDNHEAYINRKTTGQDRILYALCRPERLMELVYRNILFDAGEKKIARYQQYFCIQKIMSRIHTNNAEGHRQGGVVWHTQGSGKSLTMVMLAKAIALDKEIAESRIVLVTDRIDLDDQIWGTFKDCGKEVVKAESGTHLSKLLTTKKDSIITTVINKFDAALGRHAVRNEDPNIFVLVDEGHRSQYGTINVSMRRVLPNACYIGFTGTPIMKKEMNTIQKFGGLIDTYTIDKAVQDKAVVPLLYEGRHVSQTLNEEPIDSWFERITTGLSDSQKTDLKRKFATTDQLNKAEQKVMRIAWDISEHFKKNWQGTGFKAQLVAQDKATALLYKRYLDEFGMVNSEVLISGPDDREGEDDIYKENKEEVIRFWKVMMQKYGNEKNYNKILISAFKSSDNPEIIIVVDKLLTGFDAPRNTVLYLTRKLKDHTLLQAIARVNRLFDGKDFGFILDYRGVLENLNQALDLYSELSDFDQADLENTWIDIEKEIATIGQKHSELLSIFNEVQNKSDEEQYELLLADKQVRDNFYEKLSAFAKVFSIAIASVQFMEHTDTKLIDRYKSDLLFFMKLRRSVSQRYADTVDFGEYETKIQKLINMYVGTGGLVQITEQVNIFDKDAFKLEVDSLHNVGAKADAIAHRTAKTISEHYEEDPVYYRKFSEMLKQAIDEYHHQRIQDSEYLQRVQGIMDKIITRSGDNIPIRLQSEDTAKAYYGVLKDVLDKNESSEEKLAELAITIDGIIKSEKIVNWSHNNDVQNKMKNRLEDEIFKFRKQNDLVITFDEIDEIMEQCIKIAKVRIP